MLRIIDKEIEVYIIKILCITFFVMLTFLLWGNLENTSFASVAKYYDNYINSNDNIEYLENYYDNINNKYVIKAKINNKGKEFNYKLLLRINNDSNYDTNNINVKVNNNISALEDNRYDYSINYNYYILDINKASENKIYYIELNLLEKDENKDLNYSLEIVEK